MATLARALAPEEIRPGDYVAVLYEHWELPSYLWCCDAALAPRDELVRIRLTPQAEPAPLKVRAVCLPFVLAKPPTEAERTLDVRRVALARMDKQYARAARRARRRAVKNRHGKSSARQST